MQKQEKLLREYISILLREEGGDGGGGGDVSASGMGYYGGGGGYGGGFSSDPKIALKPFSDVLNSFKSLGKRLFASAKYLTKFALGTLLKVVTLGLFKANYGSYANTFHSDINKIRSQYAGSINDSYKSFFESDLASAVFLWNPTLYLGTSAVKKVIESRVLFEDNKKQSVVKQNRTVVESFLKKSRDFVENLMRAQTLADLPADDTTKKEIEDELKKAAEKEGSKFNRAQAEKELLATAKKSVPAAIISALENERDSFRSVQEALKVPKEVIDNPNNLVARFDREIEALRSMSKSS